MKIDNNLIIRLPNWVGDVVMALPALQALHASGLQLSVYGKPWIIDLLSSLPVKLYDITNCNRSIIRQDIARQALLFTNSFSSAWLMYISRKQVFGYNTDCRGMLLTAGLKKTANLHEVERFWRLADFFASYCNYDSFKAQSLPKKINLAVSTGSAHKIAAILQATKIDSLFMVLCPFATGVNQHGQPKIWPYWHLLSKNLHDLGITTLVCPAPGEENSCQKLVPYSHIITGINLGELLALFARAKFVIANDTGPMHLAATQTKVLGIFGVTDPLRTAPWSGDYIGSLGAWPSLDQVMRVLIASIHRK